ncbi:MAG: ATP synthase F1 subunit delta [Halanaerobiaceae bacterium]
MIKNEIASKYSQALYELGQNNNNLIKIKDELNEVWQIIEENVKLKNVLFHQRILRDEKKEVLEKLFADKISRVMLNFLKLLIDKRRIYYLEFIINEFNQKVNQAREILQIKVISAIPLNDQLFNKLSSKLDQILDYQIVLEQTQDPSILGGLKLKINNKIIDGSIKTRLENLNERLDKIPLSRLGV